MTVDRLTKIDDALRFYYCDEQYITILAPEITELIVYNRLTVLSCEVTIASGDSYVFEMPTLNMFFALMKEYAKHKGIPLETYRKLFKI